MGKLTRGLIRDLGSIRGNTENYLIEELSGSDQSFPHILLRITNSSTPRQSAEMGQCCLLMFIDLVYI